MKHSKDLRNSCAINAQTVSQPRYLVYKAQFNSTQYITSNLFGFGRKHAARIIETVFNYLAF